MFYQREVGLHWRAGPVAQLVEQGTFNPKVAGSIPARPMGSPSRMPALAGAGGGALRATAMPRVSFA